MKEKKEKAAAPAKPAKRSVTTEGMDPVGKEDADIDNDGDTDKSDEYLHKRRKAIGKAIKGRKSVKKESFSNWRDELRETMGGDKVPTKLQNEKKPTGPVKNKVVINPPMGEGFDPQKVAEGLGAELVDCQEVDESVSTGPILPGEGGKRIYPRGQEPKKTGAKLPPLQKAGFEPEGEMVEGLAQMVANVTDALPWNRNTKYTTQGKLRKPGENVHGQQTGRGLNVQTHAVKRDGKNKTTPPPLRPAPLIQQNNSFEPEGETLEEGPAALAIRAGLAAGTAIAGTKIGQEAINKVKGMVQRKKEREQPYMDLLNKGRGQ